MLNQRVKNNIFVSNKMLYKRNCLINFLNCMKIYLLLIGLILFIQKINAFLNFLMYFRMCKIILHITIILLQSNHIFLYFSSINIFPFMWDYFNSLLLDEYSIIHNFLISSWKNHISNVWRFFRYEILFTFTPVLPTPFFTSFDSWQQLLWKAAQNEDVVLQRNTRPFREFIFLFARLRKTRHINFPLSSSYLFSYLSFSSRKNIIWGLKCVYIYI